MRRGKQTALWVSLGCFIVLIGFTPSSLSAKERYEDKFEQTVDLARDGKVILSNISGDIEVKTWNKNQVKIDALKVSRTDSQEQARENFDHVAIVIEEDGGTLRIETKYAKNWFRGKKRNVSVHYWLTVPDRAEVSMKSISGDVTVSGIGAAAKADTVSGEVALTDIAGFAKGKSISGDVVIERAEKGADGNSVSGDIEGRNIAGDVDLHTVSGDIVAENIRGNVDADTVSGSIDLNGISEATNVNASALSGPVEYIGKIAGAGTYVLKSHSGSVTMVIPADAAFDIAAKTFSGRVNSDFDITVSGKLSRKEIRGSVNGGGAEVELKSFSGSINLRKR